MERQADWFDEQVENANSKRQERSNRGQPLEMLRQTTTVADTDLPTYLDAYLSLCATDSEAWAAATQQVSPSDAASPAKRRRSLEQPASEPVLPATAQGLRRCYVCSVQCGTGIRSRVHAECPHYACSVEHLLKLEVRWVELKAEARELDAAWRQIPVEAAGRVPEATEVSSSATPSELAAAPGATASPGNRHGHFSGRAQAKE